MTTVVLIGTLDTKGEEYRWIHDQLVALGCGVTSVDVGTFSDAAGPGDISSSEVAAAAGEDLAALRAGNDRGVAMDAMGRGAAAVLGRLSSQGRLDGVFAVGGSGGSSVAAAAMQALPVGVPKLLVSTMASGDVSPYVGQVDVTIMYSVVDMDPGPLDRGQWRPAPALCQDSMACRRPGIRVPRAPLARDITGQRHNWKAQPPGTAARRSSAGTRCISRLAESGSADALLALSPLGAYDPGWGRR
jgi:Uncharacterised protein family (UPF0261)